MTTLRVGVLVIATLAALLGAGGAMRRGAPRSATVLFAIASLAGVLSVAAAQVRFAPVRAIARRAIFEGVEYEREVLDAPRPVVLHWVHVAPGAPGIAFAITPATEGGALAETTREFLGRSGAAIAMNASFFVYPQRAWTPWHDYPVSGETVECLGVAWSEGRALCDEPWAESATLYLGPGRRVAFEAPADGIAGAISGRRWLVRGGEIAIDAATDDHPLPYPRAAVGLAGDALVLVAVDGHVEGRREGLTLAELAARLHARSVHDAIELDGGGSVSLAARGPGGEPVLLATPAARETAGFERVVAVSFGVHARDLASP